MGSCCQTTISSAARLSSLEISAREAQLGLASSTCPRVNICLCASPDRLGKPRRENLRTVPELDQMALSHLPSTRYPENWGRVSDMNFTLVGRSSTSKDEDKSSFALLLPFSGCLLHHLSLFFLLCFPSYTQQCSVFPPLPAPHMQFSSKLSLKRLTFLKSVQILQLFLFCLA